MSLLHRLRNFLLQILLRSSIDKIGTALVNYMKLQKDTHRLRYVLQLFGIVKYYTQAV